eukprot:gb/GECG01006629.1/.p1 GENE.gb/GECG01006629.1/~~gb/GECG01006629.1/.p1  ORF type:complete len:192 (+),score=10.73 gb/GECG01006629.1/:1-576(+)
MTMLCCVILYAALFLLTSGLFGNTIWDRQTQDATMNWLLVVGVFGVLAIPLLCSLVRGQLWRLTSRSFQFVVLFPSYVNSVLLYSISEEIVTPVAMARATASQDLVSDSIEGEDGPDVPTFPPEKHSREYLAAAHQKVKLLDSCRRGDRAQCERLQNELELKTKVLDTEHTGMLTSVLRFFRRKLFFSGLL